MRINKLLQGFTLGITLVAATTVVAQTSKPKVLVIVTSTDHFANGHPTGIWLEEFAAPYEALLKAGATVDVYSPKGGNTPVDPRSKPTEEHAKEWANASEVLTKTKPLNNKLRAADYDALFIPGGHGPMYDLSNNPIVSKLVVDFANKDKVIAAVCHGPAAFSNAKLKDGTPFIKGKHITGFTDAEEQARGLDKDVPFSLQQRLTGLGANFDAGPNFKSHTVVDGKLITGQDPPSSEAVGQLLVEALNNLTAAKK